MKLKSTGLKFKNLGNNKKLMHCLKASSLVYHG